MLSVETRVFDWAKRICVLCAIGLLPASAFAQASAKQPDRCQALDRQQNQNMTTEDNSRPANKSATEKLSDCNGVLKPPSTGDSDFVEPAPPVGNTPVIRPDEVPQRQR
ncbi:hypothetical protein [Neorhizobium galegae]|uniref:Uncharacterized protein n=1 Tax=Neorhizobium galegae bv. orientalis str. HAMBI 540 TaxID=1028800 RepID=A0A068T225_NEOGA|nr:hypothetical protein [Neorhizobium galegae]CDN51550.1 Hypothetical protein RG540_PA08740 [Neorhizobium galegae bv. orientalis str. HAMBI 540]CDZ54264.1 Hypothetical protein NGAL_HAMBI2427_55640 [Neorhizobium galegae bv. orientalis]